ncbi:MAG: C45 family peptidase [Methanocalculus sp.]|uniref:C45 family autoproteolytic acyltransferase/hydolase n=1 Tax=Methanocalculus sp. TaxID=2004547 RepID=UPI002716474C|nr:C45 family peptidase [Methanocalculus sp.]MDO9539223.1 C45 family peptidase [Methanocalculus sp.]
MRLLSILIVLALVVPTMAVILTPGDADSADAGLKQVAVFGNGTRYEAGSYHVVVLSGTYREMGRQFGALMKDELKEEYAMLRSHFTASGYTDAEVGEFAKMATALQAKRMKETRAGIAETSDLSVEEVNILYEGPIVYLTTFGAKAGCSFLAVWGSYTPDGSVVLSRNYDLPDVFSVFYPYYTLTIYNPTDGSNGVATFGPAGARPETLMNSAGLFIADDNAVDSGSTLEIAGRPDLIGEFFRFMLDYSDMDELDAGIMTTRADCAWIVNAAGPDRAYSYEETVYDIKRREGPGVIAAANHFIDPSWRLAAPPAEHSTSRYANLLRLAEENRGSIDGEQMVKIRDVQVEDCGATFRHSMLEGMLYSSDHQVVYVPETRMLWMKVVDRDWQKVELAPLFSV